MSEEIGKLEWVCQLITKDGKYLGYSKDIMIDKEWHEDPMKAIAWNLELDDPIKVYTSNQIGLNESKLIKVKKTITIESYE